METGGGFYFFWVGAEVSVVVWRWFFGLGSVCLSVLVGFWMFGGVYHHSSSRSLLIYTSINSLDFSKAQFFLF